PDATQAENPTWAGYDWLMVDTAVRLAHARGFRILLTVVYAPQWAQDGAVSAGTHPGSWQPDPTALGEFATAVGRRYSGATPDPGNPGRMLPRVDAFQGWNEPNLAYYLSPQWATQNGQLVNVAAGWYRSMLNSLYAGVKQAQPNALVVAAGMSPYGDYPLGGVRTPPALFWRDLLCLQSDLSPAPCPDPAHFDVVDSHPYDIKGPLHPAVLADDLTMPDIGKIRRMVTTAEAHQTALPGGPKQYWATEFSWESSPPDPSAVPAARQARWLEEGIYELWSQGVSVISWFLINDQPPVPDYRSTYQSGLFGLDGAPKPATTAYRFPFVVVCPTMIAPGMRVSCLAWGKAPARSVMIERLVRGRWHRVLAPRSGPDGVFEARLRLTQGAILRAFSRPSFRSAGTVNLSLNWRINPLQDGT
ncbi:MAG TPA: hypothetical protein VNR66_07390, partial [Solirubrobacteraceae bacterium]|nr:hypothetical protein [Solirubrobacteraceae bacterium]